MNVKGLLRVASECEVFECRVSEYAYASENGRVSQYEGFKSDRCV